MNFNFFSSGSRHCDSLHPEECSKVYGRSRLALVEAAHQTHPDAQRSQNGGSTQVSNGKCQFKSRHGNSLLLVDILRSFQPNMK